MSGFYIKVDGQWRQLAVESGQVEGWARPARFVVARRGRLQEASRRRALAALRAHAAGLPSAVGLGPSLSVLRCHDKIVRNICNDAYVTNCDWIASGTTCATLTTESGTGGTTESGTRGAPVEGSSHSQASAPPTGNRVRRGHAPSLDTLLQEHAIPIKRPRSETSESEDSEKSFRRPSKIRRTASHEGAKETNVRTERRSGDSVGAKGLKWSSDSESSDETEKGCKELTIPESDVLALRSYVERKWPAALPRFDADNAYKRLLLCAIKPLVSVVRCPRTERALRERVTHIQRSPVLRCPRTERALRERVTPIQRSPVLRCPRTERALRERVTHIQRSPVLRCPRTERVLRERVTPIQRSPVLRCPRTERALRERVTPIQRSPRVTPAQRSSRRGDRTGFPYLLETLGLSFRGQTRDKMRQAPSVARALSDRMQYSDLEDHAIVAWVSSGGRAVKVKGNVVWRELQDQYQRLTGLRRSWHSLRNRYLRYILPALGALDLPPEHVSRLRAAAATGQLKRKRKGVVPGRRNSIFERPAMLTASSRRILRVAPPAALQAAPSATAAGKLKRMQHGVAPARRNSISERPAVRSASSRGKLSSPPAALPAAPPAAATDGVASRRRTRSGQEPPTTAQAQAGRRKLFNPARLL